MTRYISLAEYFWLAEQVTGIDAAVLIQSSRTALADSALHAPQAQFGGHEFHVDVVEKAAVLVCRLIGCVPGPASPKPRILRSVPERADEFCVGVCSAAAHSACSSRAHPAGAWLHTHDVEPQTDVCLPRAHSSKIWRVAHSIRARDRSAAGPPAKASGSALGSTTGLPSGSRSTLSYSDGAPRNSVYMTRRAS